MAIPDAEKWYEAECRRCVHMKALMNIPAMLRAYAAEVLRGVAQDFDKVNGDIYYKLVTENLRRRAEELERGGAQ